MGELFVPHQVPRSSLLTDAKLVLKVLAEHNDLDPDRVSRFARMAHAVTVGEDNLIPADAPNFGHVIQANRDLLEFGYIFRVLQPSPSQSVLWKRFRKLFNDRDEVLPSLAGTQSDSRTLQFELLCETMLTRAGLSPVYVPHSHPDWLCQVNDVPFVVEAKMVLSPEIDSLRKRLVKRGGAADQIGKTGKPGFILLDWTFVVNADTPDHFVAYNQPIHAAGDAQVARYRHVRNREQFARIERLLSERRVIGVIFVDRLVIQDGYDAATKVGKWQLATFRDQQEILPRTVDGDKRIVDVVFESLANLGLPVPIEKQDEDIARFRSSNLVLARPTPLFIPKRREG